jgi:sorting nexin-27
VDLKILLPDREIITVSVRKNSNAGDVFSTVVDKIHMCNNAAKYFYLFEIVEYNFGEFRFYSSYE